MSTRLSRCVFVAILFLLVLTPVLPADEKSDAVDKIFEEWDSTHSPGASVAVFKDGKIVLARGYGMANLEHEITLKPSSVFRIASTSKQFTAACIAILSLRGKLDLDASVREYIPELSEIYQPVTVRQMVHHISGVRDYLVLQGMRGIGDDEYYTVEDVLDILCRQKALNFPAGEQHLYSNSGYVLLGIVVERVSGRNLADFARENVFEPLGLRNTHFHNDCTVIVPNRATGYGYRQDSEVFINETILDIIGDGGVFTTAEDMFLWDSNFFDNKLDEGLIDLMLTRGVLNNGQEIDYAFALGHGDYRGLPNVSHGGAFVGFRAEMMRFPQQHFTVVCFCNLGSMDPTTLCRRVADVYLRELMTEQPAAQKTEKAEPIERKFISLPAERLEELAGFYRSADGARVWRLQVEESGLKYVTPGYTLHFKPYGESEFFGVINGIEVDIRFEETSMKRYFHVNVGGRDQGTMQSFVPFIPTDEELSEYAGSYYSDELDVTYRIEIIDGQLFVRFRNAPEEPLQPYTKDDIGLGRRRLSFQREGGAITGFTISADRVKGILFKKK